MALTAASTLASIHAQYVANRFYALHGSVAEATLFAEACAWLVIKPVESEDRDGRVQFDRKQVQADLAACDRWLAQFAPAPTNASARVTKASFEYFRN
jgi:hypothetical protein